MAEWTEIPINPDTPDQEFNIELSGAFYTIRLRWNPRSSRWVMDLSQTDGTLLLASIPMVADWAPIYRFKDLVLPAGMFLIYDKSGKSREPDLDNFGKDVLLYYYDP